MIVNTLNLDLGFTLDVITRGTLTASFDLPAIANDITALINPKNPLDMNYYQAGILGGTLVKKFFDLNINN